MSSENAETGPYLGAMLRVVWQWVRDEMYADVARAGFDELGSAHLQVFRYPSPDGARPSELATRMQITKQSVNDLIGYLEQTGYLVREPDPDDGRARVLRLTAKGRELEKTVNTAAKAAEARVAEVLGAQRSAELRAMLIELTRDLVGMDERPWS